MHYFLFTLLFGYVDTLFFVFFIAIMYVCTLSLLFLIKNTIKFYSTFILGHT